MKLFVFESAREYPSFAVVAESEDEAKAIIDVHMQKNIETDPHFRNYYLAYEGWRPNYYTLQVAECGEVVELE